MVYTKAGDPRSRRVPWNDAKTSGALRALLMKFLASRSRPMLVEQHPKLRCLATASEKREGSSKVLLGLILQIEV